ncbi:hypothetical protein L6164_022250 [Bauhinia variegata]|uniref:Uncharacterized protein n=1 Tax=Bauhinia variegata TaxID=167791 RepID=A0ACB9MEM0_BAUVA|nr:hypothetical protein L6164_022250 [Bauhinia variegata]
MAKVEYTRAQEETHRSTIRVRPSQEVMVWEKGVSSGLALDDSPSRDSVQERGDGLGERREQWTPRAFICHNFLVVVYLLEEIKCSSTTKEYKVQALQGEG